MRASICLGVVAAASVAVALVPIAAFADAAVAGHVRSPGITVRHTPTKPVKNRPAPKPVLHGEGLVVAHTATVATVFVKTGQAAGHRLTHQTITVALPRLKSTVALRDGDQVNVQAYPQSGGYQATNMTVAPLPAMTILGTLSATSGGLLQIATTVFTDGAHQDSGEEATLVDASAATIILDGAAATVDQIPASATVAVLGERDGDIMVAAQVIAYTTAPAVAAGALTAVTGGQLQLSTGDTAANRNDAGNFDNGGTDGDQGSSDSEDGGPATPATVAVDATTATVLLNAATGSVTDLTTGDRVLALGVTNPDGSLTATTVFAFNAHDHNPAGDNTDTDNGD